MKFLIFPVLATLAIAHSDDTSSLPTLSSSQPSSTPILADPAPSSNSTNASSSDTSPPYTITALPALRSAPSCIFNCLIPVGLADASGCDDVTNDCACLSAPADVFVALTDCAITVCQSSTSEYGNSATSLFQSYCQSVYGTMSFSEAFAAESSTDAASSAEGSTSVSATAGATASVTAAGNAAGESSSAGTKASAVSLNTFFALGGLLMLLAL